MDDLVLGLLLPILGLGAGVLTTISGMGGGMLLVLSLSLVSTPALALAACAPALLLGNLHRAASHARFVDRRVAIAVASGALPGSIAGGFIAAALPLVYLKVLLVASTAFTVARSLKLVSIKPPKAALAPAGFGIGAAAATTSGAGLLLAPLLLSSGLSGEVYIATSAAIAVTMHTGRIVAYGASGLFSMRLLLIGALLAVSILGGNKVGERLRKHIDARLAARIELTSLVGCVGLAIAGLHG